MTHDSNRSAWFEPFSDSVAPTRSTPAMLERLLAASAPPLAETLVAQRVVTVGQSGLVLSDAVDEPSLRKWGPFLPSAVATLQPLPHDADARSRRERRKFQEVLLQEQSRWPDLASLRSTTFLLCADHKPPEYGLPRQLYTRHTPESLISRASFGPLLDRLISVVSPTEAPTWKHGGPQLREALTTIIFETFKNTHDHARSEANGAEVQTSVRGIYARFYTIRDIELGRVSQHRGLVTPAERYLASFIRRDPKPGLRVQPRPKVAGFLEISVVDSGPGMAARWLGSPDIETNRSKQLEAVLSCFQKGKTTTGSDGRGFGLWKVLMSLEQLHGFISVRTNAIHAYRQFGYTFDLSPVELAGGTRVPRETLLDWQKGLSTFPSEYPMVKGTVVSFLIPMGEA
ncbi:hypothetical protein ACS0X5_15545 [Burkholderia gladioli]|uniref:hypothetical protein n=1 Tax=Burkholderia gladioli TaxID=28095 RepID=UPI0015E7D4B4|nr:hypothetical protein [Burkholderia gladioli]MBA1361482.1 hypothetical protein [Burkholderia gladioli]